MKQLTIGFIGNFIPKFSTENDRKWTLLRMGHNVVTFQENETSPYTLIRYAEEKRLDLLLYSHTHDPSYVIPDLIKVFELYKKKGIPTVSVHLDRWAWLSREEDVGVEATWFTQHQFMADASPEAIELYNKHHLNWHYLAPGVIERDCYIACPDPVAFPHEIVFIGSKGYHPEYPFRSQLIEFLENTYGNRFGHYGNGGIQTVRGHELNVLCATAKIVVGDSCFGGRPFYWSDRIPETIGRGGFLLHQPVLGCDIPFSYYKGLNQLKEKIDWFIDPSHENHRLDLQTQSFLTVKRKHTYTNRMNELLEVIYG